ncbi:hypothetical protein [Streptomyces sp. NK08204]|uniref:hypothetical protein n=1 Tax=Streptomyces sp. NK08204 TaxID=2873260 RepID=UPI001CEC25B6|nr:hypothetical protein [Streptomyces sp. NK08204]
MHGGEVVPTAVVLSHTEQLARLAAGCPQALPRAVVAGDPCADQLAAGLPFRETYRRALGLRPGQRLLVVSSTWGQGSALGTPHTDLIRRALAELPSDEFRVLAAIHPNAWHRHSVWQWQNWLAPYVDSGLLLPVPETETWKAALCAADCLVGDHGSVTFYGVSLGIPCVLGAFEDATVAAGSPMDRLGRLLPRLDRTRPLLAQLRSAAESQPYDRALAEVAREVTSEPGRAAALLRRLFYGRLALPEPGHPATTRPIPVPTTPRPLRHLPYEEAKFVTANVVEHADGPAATVTLHRYPAVHQRAQDRHLAGARLTADPDDPDVRWPRSADVLLVPLGRLAGPDALSRAALAARFPGAALVAVEEPDAGCLLLPAGGTPLRCRWLRRPAWASFASAASAAHAWVTAAPRTGGRIRLRVRAGSGMEPGLLELTSPEGTPGTG